jgi:signal transduction histidine kinase
MQALRIENDGPALDAARLEHLFDAFHGDDEQGSARGLSISKRMAEQHGGYIEAANEGLGVAFAVVLAGPSELIGDRRRPRHQTSQEPGRG